MFPEAFVEGGGLYDDFDGTILDLAFVEFDYGGSIEDPVIALAVEIFNDEADPEDSKPDDKGNAKNPFVQHYSAGDLAHFVPSADGSEAVPVGSKTGLSKNCKAYKFIMAAIEAGFDKSQISNKCTVFKGAKFHFKRVKDEDQKDFGDRKKDDKKKKEDDDKKKKRDRETLLPERLISMPGQTAAVAGPGPGPKAATAGPGPRPVAGPGPGPKPGGPPKPATPAPAPATVDEAVQAWAEGYISDLLTNNNGSHPLDGLARGVTTWAKPHIDAKNLDVATRNKVIQLLGNQGWLASRGPELTAAGEPGWEFDGATLTAT